MGRPKIVRKAEEAAAIPPDHSIQVELPPEGTVELTGSSSSAAKPNPVEQQTQDDTKHVEEITNLKSQLDEMKRAAEENQRLAKESAEREIAARKQYEERNKEYISVSSAKDQAEMDAVNNAITAAAAESESAEQQLQTAYANQDWAAVTKAQAILTRAQTRLVQLEDTKVNLEARAEQAKALAEQQKSQIQAPVGDPVEAHINAMPGLNQAQREWLKSHRELMTDGRKNIRLQNAHIDAEEAGHSPGSPSYFQFIEEKLGYRKPPAPKKDDDVDDNDSPPAIVAAPPSREAPSAATGRPTPTRITLSPEQREAARAAGVDEVTYAQQLLKLQEMKKQGHYSEH